MTTRLAALALGLALPAAAQAEIPPLGRVERISEGLIAAAIAYEIGERCDSLDGRLVQGLAFLWSLESHARSLGFTREEIDAYIDDDAEKARLEAIARDRLRALGAVEGDGETYCAVGRAEMAKGSQVGRLLAD